MSFFIPELSDWPSNFNITSAETHLDFLNFYCNLHQLEMHVLTRYLSKNNIVFDSCYVTITEPIYEREKTAGLTSRIPLLEYKLVCITSC